MEKSPISYLQELIVSMNQPLPVYLDLKSDETQYLFKCVVNCANGVQGIGYGNKKKSAKHQSALDALRKFGVEIDEFDGASASGIQQEDAAVFVNYVGALHDLAVKLHMPAPKFEQAQNISGIFKVYCAFAGIVVDGDNTEKKRAKQIAAKNMLNEIEKRKVKQFISEVDAFDGKILSLIVQSPLKASNTLLTTVQDEMGDIGKIEIFKNEGHERPYVVILSLRRSLMSFLSVGATEQEAVECLMKTVSVI